MVTLPNEAGEDTEIIRNMVLSGIEVARIDLSKGDLSIWTKMVKVIHEVSLELKQEIKIYMDLSGPKIRTTTIKRLGKNGKVKNKIPIKKGEHLNLTSRPTFGKKSIFGEEKEQVENAEIGVSSNTVITNAEIGDVILIDDGMIKSKVVSKSKDSLEVVITECYKSNIGSHKRINLPDTVLNLPTLTKKDLKVLPFVCQYADILGYSVRTEKDVTKLYRQLERYKAKNIGVVFKIGAEYTNSLPHFFVSNNFYLCTSIFFFSTSHFYFFLEMMINGINK